MRDVEQSLSSRIEIGVISRVHGVRGAVVVTLHNPTSNALETAKQFWLRSKVGVWDNRVAHPGGHSGSRHVMRVDDVDTRDAAETLVGLSVWADVADIPLRAGEVFYRDVIGCQVYQRGKELGIVESIFHNGASDILVVRGEDQERLVPFVADWISHLDTAARRIELDPEGEWDA